MESIKIPFSELNFSFSRSSGSGGQNVNKVNTKVTMYWDPDSSKTCPPAVVERLRKKYPQYVLDNGQVQLIGQSHRSQKANIEECVSKLHEMLNSVAKPPKMRKPTKPKRSAVLKRLQTKKKDSEKKRLRKGGYE
jgi:ribosome-associated protein